LVELFLARPDIDTYLENGSHTVFAYAVTTPSANWRKTVASLEKKRGQTDAHGSLQMVSRKPYPKRPMAFTTGNSKQYLSQ
jgi:hypothetical protein